jgi:putative FmdB family regulatory protein
MVLHDYECGSCGTVFEASVEIEERELHCHACQKGVAKRVYRSFGSMLGRNKGVYPRFDVQLGCTLESSQHMERVAKERGLTIMGREEFDRSRHAPRTPNPLDSDEPDPQLIEIAKRAWDDVKYDRVPKEIEEDRVKTVAEAALKAEADPIDATPD